MSPFCERLSEQLCVVATIDPQAGGSAAHTSDAFSMSLHRRALFILSTGAGSAGNTVAIQEGTINWSAGTATILSAAATAVAAANSQFLFEVSGEAMSAGRTELRAIVTSVGADLISMVVLADVGRFSPESDRDLASVVSIQAAN